MQEFCKFNHVILEFGSCLLQDPWKMVIGICGQPFKYQHLLEESGARIPAEISIHCIKLDPIAHYFISKQRRVGCELYVPFYLELMRTIDYGPKPYSRLGKIPGRNK